VALQNRDALRSVVESEETQIGAPRVKFLTTALLLITACLPFVHVESPYFRSLADVTISAQNARRYVAEIYLSIVAGTHVFALSPCHCVYVCVPHTLCLVLCVCV
jgi:hypothetical protein